MTDFQMVPPNNKNGAGVIEVHEHGQLLATIVPTFSGIRIVGECITDIRTDPNRQSAGCLKRTIEVDFE